MCCQDSFLVMYLFAKNIARRLRTVWFGCSGANAMQILHVSHNCKMNSSDSSRFTLYIIIVDLTLENTISVLRNFYICSTYHQLLSYHLKPNTKSYLKSYQQVNYTLLLKLATKRLVMIIVKWIARTLLCKINNKVIFIEWTWIFKVDFSSDTL